MSTPGAVCGAKDIEYKFPTRVKSWRQWIEDTMSVHNLRGTSPPARLNTAAAVSACFTGGNVGRTQTQSLGKCCEECRANTACKVWTWRANDKSCTMSSKKVAGTKSSVCTSGSFDS